MAEVATTAPGAAPTTTLTLDEMTAVRDLPATADAMGSTRLPVTGSGAAEATTAHRIGVGQLATVKEVVDSHAGAKVVPVATAKELAASIAVTRGDPAAEVSAESTSVGVTVRVGPPEMESDVGGTLSAAVVVTEAAAVRAILRETATERILSGRATARGRRGRAGRIQDPEEGATTTGAMRSCGCAGERDVVSLDIGSPSF